MKARKDTRHKKLLGLKKVKAMMRVDQKNPKHSYLIGMVRRRIKKRKPQIYRLRLVFKTTKLVIKSLNIKGMVLNREYAEI